MGDSLRLTNQSMERKLQGSNQAILWGCNKGGQMLERIICMSCETLKGVMASHDYHYECPMELPTIWSKALFGFVVEDVFVECQWRGMQRLKAFIKFSNGKKIARFQ